MLLTVDGNLHWRSNKSEREGRGKEEALVDIEATAAAATLGRMDMRMIEVDAPDIIFAQLFYNCFVFCLGPKYLLYVTYSNFL